MKIKLLLLVGIGFMSFGASSQTSFLYNKGLMSVKGVPSTPGNPTNTTLYINGDFIAGSGLAADGSTPVVCNIYLSGSQTVLTGNFIHDLNVTGYPSSNIFTLGSETSPLVTTDYETNYATKASRFVFKGTEPQYIKLGGNKVYGKDYPQSKKGQNFINFPDLVIENPNHVTLVPELAAMARNLSLDKGRLIIDSRRAVSTDFDGITSGETFQNSTTSTMLAHFMLVTPTGNTGTVANIKTPNNQEYTTNRSAHDLYGAVQVNLSVDDPSTVNGAAGRSIIAMGSPYEEMRADYFFWNFLMTPAGNRVMGGVDTKTDPKYKLSAGQAFVFGVDLRGTSSANYTDDLHADYAGKGVKFEDRGGANVDAVSANSGKYYFSRFGPFFEKSTNVFQAAGYAPKNSLATATVSDDAYTKEVLNHTDIKGIPLVKGYNYFSNPFTVPFDVSELVSANNTPLSDAWGSSNLIVGDGGNVDRTFTNKVWVLDPTSRGASSDNKTLDVNVNYRVIKQVGQTATNTYDTGTGTGGVEALIAPLQMFVLYANELDAAKVTEKKINLPMSKRKINENALFLRSAPVANKYSLRDDFLFEILDNKTNASDRVAIAIRTPQEVMTDGEYAPTKKMFSLISFDGTGTNSETVEGVTKQTAMSIMYTKDDQGNALESNILGVPSTKSTESVVLYVSPSTIAQNITLKASRLASADNVKGITLIDKVANKEFDLKSGGSYTTSSKPTDPVDRFTVRFTFSTLGYEDEEKTSETKNITSYYANGILTVEGFEDVDFGSIISVYDLQGRRVAQAKVTDTSVNITEAFSTGAYIVKVVGKKSYAAKFLVK